MARARKKGIRTASGRLSRAKKHVEARQSAEHAETERQAMETALTTRMRHWGLSEEAARSEKAATVIGRMRMSGDEVLSEAQYQAAVKYRKTRVRYLKAIEAPTEGTPSEDRTNLADDDEREKRVRRAKECWDEAQEALQELSCQLRSHNVLAAIDYMVIRDEYHEHMEGDVKLALNALARLWELDKVYQEKAA